MAWFLGIDGGGSKTSCVVGDETSILGQSVASGSNIVRLGEAPARSAIAAVVQQACASANISPKNITRSCVGIAGAARPEIRDLVHRIVTELADGEVEVVGDMAIALHAAFGTAPGVIVIAGTGSIAYGRNSSGAIARAGGWGSAISDEGSGYWVGRSAVTACLRAMDEGLERDNVLLRRLLKTWQLTDREQLVVAANSASPPDFSQLFPAVVAAANDSDPLAVRVLTSAGRELADLARIVARRLFEMDHAINTAICGGVFGNSPHVRESFSQTLHSHCAEVRIHPNVIDPVHGALDLARKGSAS